MVERAETKLVDTCTILSLISAILWACCWLLLFSPLIEHWRVWFLLDGWSMTYSMTVANKNVERWLIILSLYTLNDIWRFHQNLSLVELSSVSNSLSWGDKRNLMFILVFDEDFCVRVCDEMYLRWSCNRWEHKTDLISKWSIAS